MFKIAHISDIHLGPLPKLTVRELSSKRITGYLNWHKNRRKRLFDDVLNSVLDAITQAAPDHIAITGDLVNLAADAEIESGARWLRKLGDPRDISFVPGNHDAYVPGAFNRICTAWRPYMLGDGKLPSSVGKHLFPYLRKRGDIALIGVSTAQATLPFMASGTFERRQASALGRLLDQTRDAGLFRIIMIHHPPVRGATHAHKRLLGIGRFSNMLKSHGAELILHGHTHLDTLYRLEGKHGSVPVVGVPSASQAPGGKRPASGFNLLTIEGNATSWNCQLNRHGIDKNSNAFKQLTSEQLLI